MSTDSPQTQIEPSIPTEPNSTAKEDPIDHTEVHADPNSIPLHPLLESTIIHFSRELHDISFIDHAAIAETPPGEPLEIQYSKKERADHSPNEIITHLSTDPLETAIPSQLTGAQREIPYHETDGAIRIAAHPLREPLHYCLTSAGLEDYHINWNPSEYEVNSSPNSIEWDQTTPVTLEFKNVSKSSLNSFEQTLKEVAPPSHPAEYFLEISKTITHTGDTTSETTKQIGSFEFKYQPLKQNENNTESDVVIIQGDATNISEPSSGFTQSNTTSPLAEKLTSTDLEDRIQLTVTSPPYLDAIDYEAYEFTQTEDYTKSNGSSELPIPDQINIWKEKQKEIFQNVYEVTKEGGYCAIIIGTTRSDGSFIDLPAEFSRMMTRELDWSLQEKITWNKITGGNSLFGTTVQHNEPKYYYANQMTEQILVFRKGEPVRHPTCEEEINLNKFVKQEISNNIWNIPPVPHQNIEHPCPFPSEIPYRLISLYSYKGETILDPMAGSGTTSKVANHLNRNAIGIDLKPKFIREARKRTFIESFTRNPQKIMKAKDVLPENATILTQTSKQQSDLSSW